MYKITCSVLLQRIYALTIAGNDNQLFFIAFGKIFVTVTTINSFPRKFLFPFPTVDGAAFLH